MRAAVIVEEQGVLAIETIPDPTPGPGQLVVRVSSCGICGSDLKARGAMPVGTVMGHEFCGEVVALGAGVGTEWREGTRAAVLPVISCLSCDWCLAGDFAHCSSAQLIGLGGSPGGFAEYAVVNAAGAFALPEEVPQEHGALVEPFAVGLHTARIADIRPGGSVLILGAGPVGLTTAKWMEVFGAKRIVMVDPLAARRELSAKFGATDAVDPTSGELGTGYDVVIDCVGKPGLLDLCINSTEIKGKIVIAGVCAEPDPYLPVLALLKELTIAFSVYYQPQEFVQVIETFASGRIDPSPLVTATLPLDQLDSAFVRLTSEPTDSKILIDPQAVLGTASPATSGQQA